jgi:hypothetical protein
MFGMAHNDIALVMWVLAAVWSMTCRRYSLAVLALTIGTLIKFIPILLVPVALLIAIY